MRALLASGGISLLLSLGGPPQSDALAPVTFEKLRLTADFHAEGASFADVDRDGHGDATSGPWWYAGPDFRRRFAFTEVKTFDPLAYSDSFFSFAHDLDDDGWTDLVIVGFPGESARWYRNPGPSVRASERWESFLALDVVDNESPAFADLTGDERPELVCHSRGRFGWAEPPADPREPWVFHALSPDLGLTRFVHGLGIGDVDGDGRMDLLEKSGWWRQPASLAGDPPWERHAFPFAIEGGAQMFAYDVDGDGRQDVITSKAAHGYGLSWFEQVDGTPANRPAIDFVEHPILPPEPAAEGVSFSELHALALADVDGDGLRDVLTGKRHWAHGPHGPEADAPAVLYAFELRRADGEATFVPHLVDDDSGVGVQLSTGDVDGDARLDIVVGNKKGAFVFLQRPPPAIAPDRGEPPRAADGRTLALDFESSDLAGWTAEGEAFRGQPVRGDASSARGREPSLHQGEHWIGGFELLGDEPVGTLTSEPFRVDAPFASFLLGGGGSTETRLELVLADEGERVFFGASGVESESLQRVVVDLSAWLGRSIRVRLVDEARSDWGHVNFDDFRFHASRPEFPRPPDLEPVLPFDPVVHTGLAPEAARAAMTVPPGFEVTLVAAEPAIHQPIAFTIDAQGRIWVVEANTYPARAPDGEGRDTIVVLEDRDTDGTFERRSVFAEGLDLVSGLEVGFGGAFVGAAPYLYFIPDRDDDLVPDGPPEALLDGFGYQDTHETLNAFTWGPDGWLYGCHGVFTDSRVGAPGTDDAERVPLDAGVWRFHPVSRAFEVFAWGTSNPWGLDFDANGQAFVTACVIPHLWHLVQGGRYERQSGSHFDPHAYDDLPTIADHLHFLGADPHAANLRSSSVGGGHAHCGALIYQESAFPQEYRGSILMHNIHGNRVNRDVLERSGSGFVGRHAPDILLANDTWFRGIALHAGPDGAVYLSDWYDAQACHDERTEQWDRTNGRLYRVSWGPPRPVAVDLASLPSEELVRLSFHRDEWFARRARVILAERGAEPATRAVLARAFDEVAGDPGRSLRALWALHVTGGLEPALARRALASPHEYVRAWAIQCMAEDRVLAPEELERCVVLARADPSPVVRLYLACALQRLAVETRFPIARELLLHEEDASDPNLPLLLWYAVEPLVAARPAEAFELLATARLDVVARFLVRRAAAEPDLQGRLVEAIASADTVDRRAWMLEELASALRERSDVRAPASWPALYAELRDGADPAQHAHALEIALAYGDPGAFPELRAVARDPGAPVERRGRALSALMRGGDPERLELLRELLDEPELRLPAIRGLATCDDASVPELLVGRFASLSEDERRAALGALSARASHARELLRSIERGALDAAELDAFLWRQLADLGDPEVAERIARLAPEPPAVAGSPAERAADLKARLAPDELARADLPRGRDVFARTCMSCHVLFGNGGTLGPDLTGSNRADLDYLLRNVLEPNAEVGADYRSTLVRSLDGRLLTGIEVRRTSSAVVLRTRDEELAIPLDEIEEIELSPLSTMPEGLVDALAFDEIRDLVAYLASPVEVPRLATRANAGIFFDGRSLAGWHGDPELWRVEDGELVGRGVNLAHNDFLKSDLELRDFRLSLEVRLVRDEGNSGVQFRSRELEGGGVSGYQGDIGESWWGALYEEEGRGMLVVAPTGTPVLRDGWNRYEIRAEGHRVRTWLNGEPCVDLDDPTGALAGIVALQVHSGGSTEVRFRKFELDVLD
jgi:putative membrane-bound dehydrogenase-like protein